MFFGVFFRGNQVPLGGVGKNIYQFFKILPATLFRSGAAAPHHCIVGKRNGEARVTARRFGACFALRVPFTTFFAVSFSRIFFLVRCRPSGAIRDRAGTPLSMAGTPGTYSRTQNRRGACTALLYRHLTFRLNCLTPAAVSLLVASQPLYGHSFKPR